MGMLFYIEFIISMKLLDISAIDLLKNYKFDPITFEVTKK